MEHYPYNGICRLLFYTIHPLGFSKCKETSFSCKIYQVSDGNNIHTQHWKKGYMDKEF
jgi:hypothetical protein